MKTIIGILLVGLLGFLGCGDSDDGTVATPGEAIPVAPFGVTDTTSPITYKWTPVPWATKYRLLVQDKSETAVIEEWYTADEGECASEDGLCMVTPDIEVIGTNMWKVLACVGEVCGLWSDELQFSFLSAKRPPRFKDSSTLSCCPFVLDNNTGLEWTRSAAGVPPDFGPTWYGDGEDACRDTNREYFSPKFRIPKPHELYSLIDESLIGHVPAALPYGHPFERVRGGWYWVDAPTEPCARDRPGGGVDMCEVALSLATGEFKVQGVGMTSEAYTWCVRTYSP